MIMGLVILYTVGSALSLSFYPLFSGAGSMDASYSWIPPPRPFFSCILLFASDLSQSGPMYLCFSPSYTFWRFPLPQHLRSPFHTAPSGIIIRGALPGWS
ncbi:hypothetical protein BJY00DRAFT_131881 [Aspergillus carlsbadensis]|nr:hypothetical protein BJY00DRAFT_131881 [Aspergillus carlsbadensis]